MPDQSKSDSEDVIAIGFDKRARDGDGAYIEAIRVKDLTGNDQPDADTVVWGSFFFLAKKKLVTTDFLISYGN